MTERPAPPDVDRVAASQRAVAARRERASLKQDVATRVISPQELLSRALAAPHSPAGAMRVTEFLTAIPAIGVGKRDRILERLQISPVKRLGGLGRRQQQ
ncbi:MAG TPA: guanylate kinase, partial [Microbacterium sp.]|nr:guanylate kinase [Microbacterium sp.]